MRRNSGDGGGGTDVLDILKWEGSILEVELRVASQKHVERAQSNFPVSICTTGKRDEAQREAGTRHKGQEVTFCQCNGR